MGSATVGVDVGGSSIRAVRFDGDLVPVDRSVGPTPRGAVPIAAAVAEHVHRVADGATAVAVGIPGRVDPSTGVVSSAVNLGIDEPVPLGRLVADLVGRPVHVENDVNAAALGAFAHLARPAGSSLAYVNVGTGIAAGLVLAGRLWRGATGAAGEIGHLPMSSHGPACACGQVGCAEAVGSGRAVLTDARRRDDIGTAVAWAVQLCVMALDVDIVVLGGGLAAADGVAPAVVAQLTAREASSSMLRDLGLAARVHTVAADVPVGSLGAVLAARSS